MKHRQENCLQLANNNDRKSSIISKGQKYNSPKLQLNNIFFPMI